MYDADVDQVDAKEDDHLNNSDDAIIDSDDDDDAGIFSNTNGYSREDDDTLADEQKEKRTPQLGAPLPAGDGCSRSRRVVRRTHSLLVEVHRQTNAWRVRKLKAKSQSVGTSWTRCALSSRDD